MNGDQHAMHGSMQHQMNPMNSASQNASGHGMMMMKGSQGNSSGHNMMMMDHSMKMYFHVGVFETILFEGWKTSSVTGMVLSCIGVFFLGMAYEALKSFRAWIAQKMAEDEKLKMMMPGTENETKSYTLGPIQLERGSPCRASHLIQTVLHVIQLVLSYALMLIFMTFNVWLCLAVALGSGVGYFCFGWITFFQTTTSDHCG